MLRKVLMVVLMVSLLVFPAAASAQDVAPLWHCDSVSTPVAGNPGWNYTASGAASWWRTKRVGGAVVGIPQTSPQFVNFPIAEGIEYQVQAADSQGGPWSNDSGCVFSIPPLAVVIETFTAACSGVPYGSEAAIAWSVNTELLSTDYLVALAGDVVLNVPAACPGCTAAASYERSVSLPDAHGIYTLMVYNGDDLTDTREFWLAPCAAPTAVKVSSFTATTTHKRGRR